MGKTMTRGEIQDLIGKFATENPKYRAALLKDPKGIIEKQLNTTLGDVTLKAVEDQFPDFFGNLVRQCYNGYYSNPEVFDLIGYPLPAPENYQPKPFDESLLEPQRQRAPFWRQV